jgi:hypothetical protein
MGCLVNRSLLIQVIDESILRHIFSQNKGLLSDIRQHQVTSPFVAGELSLFVTKWLTPPFQKPGVGVKRRVFEACLMTF